MHVGHSLNTRLGLQGSALRFESKRRPDLLIVKGPALERIRCPILEQRLEFSLAQPGKRVGLGEGCRQCLARHGRDLLVEVRGTFLESTSAGIRVRCMIIMGVAAREGR